MSKFSDQSPWRKTIQMVAVSSLVLSLAACGSNESVKTSMGDTSGSTPQTLAQGLAPEQAQIQEQIPAFLYSRHLLLLRL